MNGPKRPPVIGIIGGIGSGKSTVARMFEEMGAVVLDADKIGHAALRRPEVKAAARRRWGEAVFGRDGEIDRSTLAQIVFGKDAASRCERAYLESLVHPLISEGIRTGAAEARSRGACVVVIDAALLVEAGWDRLCDCVVYVDARADQQWQRAATARGWTEDEVAQRQASQESLRVKRERADEVVDNSGSLEETLQQVARIYSKLTAAPPVAQA